MKIIIGIPSQDMWHADFALSLFNMCSYSTVPGMDLTLTNERGCYIDSIRNRIVQIAMERKGDYLLFLDSDMTFPKDTLNRLLSPAIAHPDINIIGTNYTRRRSPYSPTAMGLDGKTIMPGRSGIEKVIAVPTGVILINMKVFQDMKYPWFDCLWNPDGVLFGEDTRFCAKAHKAGHPVFCDHDLSNEIGHIGQFIYKMEHFDEKAPA